MGNRKHRRGRKNSNKFNLPFTADLIKGVRSQVEQLKLEASYVIAAFKAVDYIAGEIERVAKEVHETL